MPPDACVNANKSCREDANVPQQHLYVTKGMACEDCPWGFDSPGQMPTEQPSWMALLTSRGRASMPPIELMSWPKPCWCWAEIFG